MRMYTFVGIFALCGWLATTASAQVGNTAKANVSQTGQAGAEQRASQGTGQTRTGAGEKQGNSWRYVFYKNQWWYYLPSKQWLVWNGSRWMPQTELAQQNDMNQQPFRAGYRGGPRMYDPGPVFYQSQPGPDPTLGRPIYRRFFPNMPFVPFPEDPTTSQPVTGAGQR